MPKIQDHSISFIDFFNERAKGMKLWNDVDSARKDSVRFGVAFLPTTWLVLDAELSAKLLGPHDGIYGGSVQRHEYSDKYDSGKFTLEVKRGVWKWGKHQIVSVCEDYEEQSGISVTISVT